MKRLSNYIKKCNKKNDMILFDFIEKTKMVFI